ncbi:MAG: DUF1156 domain-containing protein [Bacteroidota bacterium]
MPDKRLIETAFPLKETSLDSVHDKRMRHGHPSMLHIWPARRPLPACRAALLATLLPAPRKPEDRAKLVEAIGGRVEVVTKNKKQKEVTKGGVLRWKRERGPRIEQLRARVREHYGRPPIVMDPFSGGGAIPLEAMRLGCQTVAADINPVAWFILKCALDYPHRIGDERRPLPAFAAASDAFLTTYLKKTTKNLTGKRLASKIKEVREGLFPLTDLGLAWHVYAWGHRLLDPARADLAPFYPTVGGATTVAYLWARTLPCKSCGATLPLLKTRWIVKTNRKRVLLTMTPNEAKTGVVFGLREGVPKEGTGATLREADKRLGAGTMSRAGATCPCCTHTMTMDELRDAAQAGQLGTVMTAVAVEGEKTKDYRLPTDEERQRATEAAAHLDALYQDIPFGLPTEPLPETGVPGIRVPLYGFDTWADLYTPRQLLALGTLVRHVRAVPAAMEATGYPREWIVTVAAYLALAIDRFANQHSMLARWNLGRENVEGVFARYALPMLWDFAEVMPVSGHSGSFPNHLDWLLDTIRHLTEATSHAPEPDVLARSALETNGVRPDVILTDPPYYDAIPYAALMDYFYVWLRRSTHGLAPDVDAAFEAPLSPKWDPETQTGELIDDSSRFGGDGAASKQAYEDGMAQAFKACYDTLADDGRFVIVFAHKDADAWETLVSAIIRSGFTVTASWPIQTEMGGRARAQASAALSSSIWLVCQKRPQTARPGWDTQVIAAMRKNITTQLRQFWDAGIRGADFVWAATGPALEAYSAHPYVKKTNAPGEVLTVDEFLDAARRIVLDYAVSGVFSEAVGETAGDTQGLDNVTAYYLLHRSEFGFADVPVGASILYAVSCGLSDTELADRYDLLRSGKGRSLQDELDDDDDDAGNDSSSATVRLKTWKQRTRKTLGQDVPGDRPVPLIDKVHRLVRLYNASDLAAVDEYIRQHGLADLPLCERLVTALAQIAGDQGQSQEKNLLDAIASHLNESVGMISSSSGQTTPSLFE